MTNTNGLYCPRLNVFQGLQAFVQLRTALTADVVWGWPLRMFERLAGVDDSGTPFKFLPWM